MIINSHIILYKVFIFISFSQTLLQLFLCWFLSGWFLCSSLGRGDGCLGSLLRLLLNSEESVCPQFVPDLSRLAELEAVEIAQGGALTTNKQKKKTRQFLSSQKIIDQNSRK